MTLPPLHIAVTGGTGFIGRNLLATLVDRDIKVRALTRGDKPVMGTRLTWMRGSMESSQALATLVRDTTHVIHLAGRVRANTRDEFMDINTEVTGRLARICAATPSPPKLLLMSSLAAREPELSHYAASKYLAELTLQGLAGGGTPWTIFRPPAVYGPGDSEVKPLFELASKGIFLTPKDMTQRLSLLHVEDLTSAIIAWLAAPGGEGQIFEPTDPTPGGYDWTEIATHLEGHFGRKLRLVPMPRQLLMMIAHANLAWGRLSERATMLSPGKVRELLHTDWTGDPSPMQEAFNWCPRIPLSSGLRMLEAQSSPDT